MYPCCWNKPHARKKPRDVQARFVGGLKERSAHEKRRANRKQHRRPHHA
ncbi:Uncharacterized protein DBV15_10629 [Temnothorax longispinosus]|uniref:Uncharacterized protein n=1 Tax=Temnothorax longispinosus TaxID=300112 RepID=A0A4S2KBT7_9HYME|nr:Uncharacterized protein DBV15_10629 [Temnothorax longispinosus]